MENIGAYRVLSRVGDGGMAVVYRCRHRSEVKAAQQGGDVAVKVMHAHLAMDAGFQTRFEREAGIGLELNHPGIVKVLDLIVDQERLALVMEWVEGDPLDLRLERGPIPEAQALEIFQSIAQALSYAHEQGVVHRDVKPANILLARTCAKVLDFGIAKSAQQASLTRTGAGIGTPWYMAPEQYVRAKNVDARADIYALGMVLAEMLMGGLPWPSELSEYEVLRHKADGELSLDAVPEAYRPIIGCCLEPDPADRWASVQALLSALRGDEGPSAQTEKASSKARTPPKPQARTHRSGGLTAAGLGAALLAVLGFGAVAACGLGAIIIGGTRTTADHQETRATTTEPVPGGGVRGNRSPRETIDWIAIQGGAFTAGTDAYGTAEGPSHRAFVYDYSIMKNEVTVGEFQACISDGTCRRPSLSHITGNTKYCTLEKNSPNLALNCISWHDADTFCAWLGGRLPSEYEWEYAARSQGKSHLYSWGHNPDWECTKSVSALGRDSEVGAKVPSSRACGLNNVAAPCTKPQGNTDQGLCDMGGNLWEWAADCSANYSGSCKGRIATRGGGFYSNGEQVRTTRRFLTKKGEQVDDVGFRCVKPAG